MLKYALSDEGTLVHVTEESAGPHFCPDCFRPVGKKRGLERDWHFFHLETEASSPSCRHSGNCLRHEAIQHALQERCTLPILMEHPVEEARRIADLAILKQKIAIEIQRSHLSFDALLARTEAYLKADWHVLWLISSKLYHTSPTPQKLIAYGQVPHYFFEEKNTCIDIWDSAPDGSLRPIHTFIPKRRTPLKTASGFEKRKNWTVHLEGDFLDMPLVIPQKPKRKSPLKLYIKLLWLKIIA